jgi:hypothetical protein
MYPMSQTPQISHPQDICLLLRSHGEQYWLIYEVLPVLRQLETPGSIPEDQLGAALAYLELMWLDACRRARETDASYAKLLEDGEREHDPTLCEKARRYHASVRRLRVVIGHRIGERLRLHSEPLDHLAAGH